MKRILPAVALILILAGCAANEPVARYTPDSNYTPLPVRTSTPAPVATPAPAAEIIITFYGSDIQVLGSTYDDTPSSEDHGRVASDHQVVIPPGTGFYWGAVSWNGTADAGCRVTRGEEILIDNTAPDQTSAVCMNYEGF